MHTHMPGCIVTRLLSFVVVVGLLISSAGCGAVFIGGAITTGSTIQGTVSTVQVVGVNGQYSSHVCDLPGKWIFIQHEFLWESD